MTATKYRNDDPPDWGSPICTICGADPYFCSCPECPKCGAHGDPNCWVEHDLAQVTGKQPNHEGMRLALKRIDELNAQLDDLQEIADELKAKLEAVRNGRDRLIDISDDLENLT